MTNTKAALVGALLAIVGNIMQRLATPGFTDNNTIPYWGGVIITGAFLGVCVAAIARRMRA